jgi:hypothetical protein
MARCLIRFALLVFCSSLAVAPGSSYAGPLGLTFVGGGVNSSVTDTMAGWQFSMNTSTLVDGLGFWDYHDDGLAAQHQVGIWTDTGTLVASTTVSAGTTDPLISDFRVHEITPVMLDAGVTYRIAGYYGAGNTDAVVTGGATVTTDPSVNFLKRAYQISSGGFTFPTGLNGTLLGANFGPTFRLSSDSFSSPLVPAVPEPASLVSFGIGIAGAGLVVLRRRRAGRASS